jgi:hypothetical protein
VTWTSLGLPAGAVARVSYEAEAGDVLTNGPPRGGPIASVPASAGSFTWTVPTTPGGSWRVTICVVRKPAARGADSCLVRDSSDAPFSIGP